MSCPPKQASAIEHLRLASGVTAKFLSEVLMDDLAGGLPDAPRERDRK
jgi:hypothetical protein